MSHPENNHPPYQPPQQPFPGEQPPSQPPHQPPYQQYGQEPVVRSNSNAKLIAILAHGSHLS